MKSKFYLLLFSVLASLSVFTFTACDDDEKIEEEIIETAKVKYSCQATSDLAELVDMVIVYVDKDGKEVSEKLEGLTWNKEIVVKKPFKANVQIKCNKKGDFTPNKEYYEIGLEVIVHERMYRNIARVHQSEIVKFIDNFCKFKHGETSEVE